MRVTSRGGGGLLTMISGPRDHANYETPTWYAIFRYKRNLLKGRTVD